MQIGDLVKLAFLSPDGYGSPGLVVKQLEDNYWQILVQEHISLIDEMAASHYDVHEADLIVVSSTETFSAPKEN